MHIKGSEVISHNNHVDNGNFTIISSDDRNVSEWTTSLETVNHNYEENCENVQYAEVLRLTDDHLDEELDLETIKDCIKNLEPSLVGRTSPTICDYSTDEGLFEYEDGEKSSSSSDESQQQDDEAIFDDTDTDDSYHEQLPRGIYNPNYPGFQHFAYTLQGYETESPHEEFNNNECDLEEVCANLNHDIIPESAEADAGDFQCDLITLQREIYEVIQKPMTDSLTSIDEGIDCVMRYIEHFDEEDEMTSKEIEKNEEVKDVIDAMEMKTSDAYMSDARENIRPEENSPPENPEKSIDNRDMDLNYNNITPFASKDNKMSELENIVDNKTLYESLSPKKESKSFIQKNRKHDGFDVYNIETAMPAIDLEAIENHLRAAREEERKRRHDREEIRRRLAMGSEDDYYQQNPSKPGRKPSLQSRLQSGMNLQICFMNETASDNESLSESENNEMNDNISNKRNVKEQAEMKYGPDYTNFRSKNISKVGIVRPTSLSLQDTSKPAQISKITSKADFFECQARLQAEARMALAQAKEMARIQMEIDRQNLEISPITEMLRYSLQKAGVDLLGDRRRVSRQMLTDMNVAQLQVIVNELHTQIEHLNEDLVQLLIARDELHMSQDSMLVDIEDLTRYLGARDINTKTKDFDKMPQTDINVKNNNTQSTPFLGFTALLQK